MSRSRASRTPPPISGAEDVRDRDTRAGPPAPSARPDHHPFRADPEGISFDVYDVVTQRFSSQHYVIAEGRVETSPVELRYAWPSARPDGAPRGTDVAGPVGGVAARPVYKPQPRPRLRVPSVRRPMLFTPEAHEPLADEPWSAETARTAIAGITADVESTFDDGWSMHPDWTSRRATTRRCALPDTCISAARGSSTRSTGSRCAASSSSDATTSPTSSARSKLRRTFPTTTRSAASGCGETGIRLVLQRLAPSQANLERLYRADRGERAGRTLRAEGAAPTILAGRELGLDVTASIEWLRGRRDREGLWTQQLAGLSSRPDPASSRVRRLRARTRRRGPASRGRSSVSRSRRMGSSTGRHSAGRRQLDAKRRRSDPHAVVPRRAGDRRNALHPSSTRSWRWLAAS